MRALPSFKWPLPKMTAPALQTRYVCRGCARKLRGARRAFSGGVARRAAAASPPELYDVVCVGGGPAGLSLLTALKSHPSTAALRVALIDSQDLHAAARWAPPPGTFSNRASSLTPATRAFLARVGAWAHLDAARVQPVARMQVWDGVSGARVSFGAAYAASNDPPVAFMTENPNLVRALLQRLAELGCGPAELRGGARVADMRLPSPDESSDTWPRVTLASGDTLAARLLVGADGVNSRVRGFAGIPARGWQYGRAGVVATLDLAEDPQAPAAFQRFLPTGPVAMLPLPGRRASLVWSTTPELADALKRLAPADFAAMVDAAFRLSPVDLAYMLGLKGGQVDELGWRLAHSRFGSVPPRVAAAQEGSVAAFPLRMMHADAYAAHRVALVGDAAHAIHPLAGQGLNMGVGDAQALAAAVAYAVQHGMDVGDQLSLERYAAERYATNNLLMGVVDKLHKLYSVGSGPLVGLRSVGLRAVDAMGPVKEFLMRQAAGL